MSHMKRAPVNSDPPPISSQVPETPLTRRKPTPENSPAVLPPLKQPLFFLLPGQVQITSPGSAGNFERNSGRVHQIIGPTTVDSHVHHLVPARQMQTNAGNTDRGQCALPRRLQRPPQPRQIVRT